MISAQVIADSINSCGERCTTFLAVFPRIVLAEANTHRAISKNSASSRAIPFHRMVSMVQDNPFIPIRWMKAHKGMQGNEYFTDEKDIKACEIEWLKARNSAVEHATLLSDIGVTKQVCNRLLEPFMWHTVIMTGTDWGNYFALRAHEAAEIHIQDLAYKMLEAYNASTPKSLKEGEWHIPFGDKLDLERLEGLNGGPKSDSYTIELKLKIATARCARVSYLNFEGKDDYLADIKLHDELSKMGHWSPFEHCAQALPYIKSGNFSGFKQYRKFFMGENAKDPRIETKLWNSH